MSTSFLILAAVLAALTGFVLVRPLRGSQVGSAHRRRRANTALYREQLADLTARRRDGALDEDEFKAEKAELDIRLIADVEGETEGLDPAAVAPLLRVVILALPALLGAGLFWLSQGEQHFQAKAPAEAPGNQPSIEQMVEQLARRLEENPQDLQGWALLGRSYTVMQRFADAAKAFARANALSGAGNADLLVAEGESLALARDQDLLGRPRQLFAAALEIDPDHVRGLWYAALAARQAGDEEIAESYLAHLRAQPELPAELARLLGVSPVDEERATSTASVEVSVSLAPDLRTSVAPESTLFIYARARQGPPMPLAIQRLQAAALPVTVTLDESMAMVEGMSLSRFAEWDLVARISASGSATAQSGDLQGVTPAGPDSDQPVTIVIDGRLP